MESTTHNLAVTYRAGNKKSDNNKLRREGQIPAVIYSEKSSGEMVAVDGIAFKKVLQKIPQGTLATVIFSLKGEKGEKQAIVKDIQYNITTYDVIHLDFLELVPGTEIELNVPIQLVGSLECAGVKQGGLLRQVIRALKVRCPSNKIPTHFEINVKEMNLGESKKLEDVKVPSEVRPVGNLKEIAVVVAKSKS